MGNDRQPRLSWWAVLAKALRSASLNAQKHCPPYTQDPLIPGLPQTLDAPLLILNNQHRQYLPQLDLKIF